MLRLVTLEMRKIKKVYLISLVIGLLYSGFIIMAYTTGWSFNVNIQIWDISNQILCYIYPLFAVMPTCWLLYYERKNHFIAYTQTRIAKSQYISSKYMVSSISGGLIIFSMSMIGLVICLYLVPRIEASPLFPIKDVINITFEGEYYVSHPFMYGFILSLWRFVIGFLIASFGFVLALYVKNLFIIFTFPFMYTIGENIIMSLTGCERYMLFTSFCPSYLSRKAITYSGLLVGPIVLIIVIAITALYFTKIKKAKVFEI